jgi:hypothetical protein
MLWTGQITAKVVFGDTVWVKSRSILVCAYQTRCHSGIQVEKYIVQIISDTTLLCYSECLVVLCEVVAWDKQQ